MRPRPRHPRPYGGASPGGGGGLYQNPNPNIFPQNPNAIQFPFSPQFFQQQQFFPQNPNFQNPFIQTLVNALPQSQNPNFQNFHNPFAQPPAAAAAAAPPPRPPQVTLESVESAVAKAQRDLVTAGENVTAWKVSQAALLSLQVDSWGSLGFQLQDVQSLRQLLATEGKINAFIHCFVGAQRITSLYDLEVAICKNEGIERFEELGLGPLPRHPLAQHYFLIPSNSVEIFKISSEDIITYLRSLLNKSNKRTVSAEELLGFIADQKSVPVKEKLGIRIQSLGWHISCIRQAKKSEKTILTKSLDGNKCNGEENGATELAPSASMHAEKEILHKRFDYISDRVKQFSSLSNLSCGKHTHFNYSSNDECDISDENVDGKNINSGPYQNSSYDYAAGQSCPYPSAAEEMKRLGLKFDTGEKETPLKDKLMDVWSRSSEWSKSSSKKRKRKLQEKRQEKLDNTMNKFLRKEEFNDCRKKLCNVTLPGGFMENFVTTWKEACQEHSAAEVLDLMINFYMASTTEKERGKFRKIFSSFPGVGLLNVAVTSIKRGLSVSLYDTVQIFSDHCSAPSAEIIEINPSVKEDPISNTAKDINECDYRVTVDDVIRNVAEFFRLDVVIPSETQLSYGKLFKTLKRFRDCEMWLAAHFSVKEFSSLGHGNFFDFLEKHASLLPNEQRSFLNEKSPEPSHMEVSMLQYQLEILLSQAKSNLIDERDISMSDISLVLKKQFPTISFHIMGDEPEKYFLDLTKRQKDCSNSSSIVYSMSLLGKFSTPSTPEFLAFQENLLSENQTGQKIYSHANASSKDAIDSLLKVPMLSDLLSWSHWDVLYAPSFGPLSDWLLNENIKELSCIATMDGKFIRIDQSATADDFLDAMVKSSPFQVALKLLSLLSSYGGVSKAPVSLLKCYVQRAIDVIIRNSTSSMELGSGDALTQVNAWQGQASRGEVSSVGTHSVDSQGCYESFSVGVLSGINDAVINISIFILECLDYLPLEFRNFGSDILVSGLRSVAKDAHSVLLRACSRINQRLMLHDIGLSLGIAEWIDDFREFSSKTNLDMFIFSTTLHKTSLCSGSDSTTHHTDTSEKPISNDHNKFVSIVADASDADVYELNDGDDVGENGSVVGADGPGKRQDFNAAVGEYSIMADRAVQDATSIVESIRREEFGLDPNLNYSDSCMLKKQHARLGRALHCLSQELYSQDSHLLLELVQNADDNNYPEDVDPTLVFILQDAGIVVLNNEHGFSAENIRALCDIGNSTKKGSKAGYIGHKGIGFKSVFRVTDAPEIHSNGFHVKFDITEGQIGFVLPTVISSCDVDMFRQMVSSERYSSNDTQWNTCIVLPFRSKSIEGMGMTSIISMFSDLHPSLLLFLHRLRCIKYMNMLNNTFVDMRREILGNGIVKVSHGQETMTWLVTRKKLPANHIRSDVKSTEIAVAFTLEECDSGEYNPHLIQQPVFAFLPLRNYGLKFIVQGDFVLPSSREEVDGNSAWNQWLLSEFPVLFVSAEQSFCSLPCFQKCQGKAVTIFLSFVPNGGEVHGFFSHLPQMIISKLRMSNCLLLDGPDLTWVLPCRVLRGWNDQARRLLPDNFLQKHLGLGYLSKDVELSDALAKALGIKDYGPKVLIEIISSVCCSEDGIMSLGFDWLSAWLCALHSALSTNSGSHSLHARFEHDLISSLRKVPFIPLSDGSYSSVVDGTIWLPSDASSLGIEGKYSVTEFPNLYAKLRTVNSLLLSAATNNTYIIEDAKSDNLVHMLCKIGVQQLSAHEVIKSHILMALSSDKYMDEHKDLMIEYLSYTLLHFQYDCARCGSEKKEIISELRKSPVLLTNRGYKSPTAEPVHFSKEYMNPVDTDKFSCTMDDRWLEVDAGYLKHPSIQSLSLGVQKWRIFFQELGVTDFVQVSSTRKSTSDYLCTSSGDMTPVGDLTVAASIVDDWESSELLNLLSTFSSNKCREKCIYLLEVLDKMWDDVYNAYSRSYIVSKPSENMRTIESTFLKSLRHFEWIASSMDLDLHQSKDLFYDCVEVRSILGNLAPYAVPQVTSKLLLKDIGFKTEVSLDDALEILHFWNMSKAPFRTSILQMSKFYTFISDGLIRSKIPEEFTSSSFIFVPFLSTSRNNDTVSGIFLSPKELYWHDPTGCVDKTKELVFLCSSTEGNSAVPCKALATIYPGLYDFFVNICGVPKNPPSGSYFQILQQLSSIALPSQAAHVVFQVFVKWADDLKSGLVNPEEILELKENLLKSENTVLPTLQDKWVSLHSSFGLICWSDDDELKEQFKYSDSIDFLNFGELKKEDCDKLSGTVTTLMHDIGVPAISEVVSREAIFYGTHDNMEKASLINWILPYAQRYIYKLYPHIYLGQKQLGFEKLNQLQVIVVDKLFYKNCLKGWGTTSKKRFECCCLLQGSTLYTTLTADTHSIFLELSRLFFNGSTELHFANFLHMVTTMAESGSTSEQTEFFILNSQKIPMLPDEEPAWYFSSITKPPVVEDSKPSLVPMSVDQNSQTAEKKSGPNTNWPPTGWRTAPDISYAKANYHLTKPCGAPSMYREIGSTRPLGTLPVTDDLPIPVEIETEWIIEEGATAAMTIASQDSVLTNNKSGLEPVNVVDGFTIATSEHSSEPGDSALVPAPQKERLRYNTNDEQQLWKTGRVGEMIAYKYFVDKLGSGNVRWVNEGAETGLPYDLITGVEESSREYIEVKATRHASKDWFEISTREWQFAVERGDSYSIAHVVVGAKKASISVLRNPSRLCQQNVLHLALLMSRQVKESAVTS